jgi:hypothetical protein
MTIAAWGDCERMGGGWLEQPVNAWSSLSFAAVGVAVAASGVRTMGRERVDRVVFGMLLALTGVGSFLFHRDPVSWRLFHDLTFLGVVWFLGSANLTGALGVRPVASRALEVAGAAIVVLIVALAPGSTNAAAAVLVAGLIASDVVLWRRHPPLRNWYALALVAALVGVALYVAGRTGSPWCDPDGVLQAHAGWHVLAAVALGSYFLATTPARSGAP